MDERSENAKRDAPIMTATDVIVAYLARAGTRRFFGVPGDGSSLDIIEAARRHSVSFVAAHQVRAAVIMAATDGDLAARPGVCVAASGSSAAASLAGLRHAYVDRLPVILLSGSAPRSIRRLGPRRIVGDNHIFQAVTKESGTIKSARAERMIAAAWEEAAAHPAGPVHLSVPADESVMPSRERAPNVAFVESADPSPSATRKVARLLTRRGRAVVVAGLGCREASVVRALRELVEHLGAPVLTTRRAKGVIPEDHPLSAGVFFGGPLEEELLGRSDCVLAVGLDPAEIAPRAWKASPPVLSMTEYRITPSPFEAAAEVVGGLTKTLDLLRGNLPPAGEWSFAAWAKRGGAFRGRARALLAESTRASGGLGIAPHRVVEVAREIFPRPTLAAADAGAHALVVTALWETYEPKTFLCSSGLADPGYALPAAIAAKLARPERPVVAFMGDTGFLLSIPEVATAARLELPLAIIVFADEAMSFVRVAQEQKRYQPIGSSLSAMDIPKLAEGLGALGTMVEDEDGLRSALSDATATTRPAIIAVRVNPHGYRKMAEALHGKIEP